MTFIIWFIPLAVIACWCYAQFKGNIWHRLVSSLVLFVTIGLIIKVLITASDFYGRGYTGESMRLLIKEIPEDRKASYDKLVEEYRDGNLETSDLMQEFKKLQENEKVNDRKD